MKWVDKENVVCELKFPEQNATQGSASVIFSWEDRHPDQR